MKIEPITALAWPRFRLGLFLPLLFLLWRPDAVFCTCSIGLPTLNIPSNVTVECQYDSPSGVSPDLIGQATSETFPDCPWCPATVPYFIDYVLPNDDTNCCSVEKKVRRTWITHACEDTVTKYQFITIRDTTPPSFLVSFPRTVDLGCSSGGDTSPEALGTPVPTDNCSPSDAITLSYTDQFYPARNGTCAESEIKRTWSATDDCGNTGFLVQHIYNRDNTPPTWQYLPSSNVSVSCNAITSPAKLGSPTATGNCSDITYHDEVQVRDTNLCSYWKTIKRTWTARGECGNSNEFVQLIQVSPTPPKNRVFNAFCLWPPNHFYYAINNFTTSDLVTANASCGNRTFLTSPICISNQPDDDTGDGRFTNDCFYDEKKDTLFIRSERSGNILSSRVYKVSVTIVDNLNPNCQTSAKVLGKIFVPHDQAPHDDCSPPNTRRK